MKIIIAGAGKIGKNLAEILADEGHDLTIIERDSDTIGHISNTIDAICIEGSATNPEVLAEAGAANADLIVAVTEKDEVNMICGIAARSLGTKYVVARIRDPEYLSQRSFLRDALGLALIINPEYECAKEISRILRMPGAARVEAFPKSNAEIVEFKVGSGSPLAGIQLSELEAKTKAKVLIAAIERNENLIIPGGRETISAGDRISVIGASPEMRRFFIAAGEYRKPAKNAIIMGGGRISVYLARLLRENGINASIIDVDRARCEILADYLPKNKIICGDATRSDVLSENGIDTADAFIALTGDDGDNIVASMYAESCGVDKVITKVDRSHYLKMLENSPLDSLVTPRTIISQQIAKYVRALSNSVDSGMETMYRIANEKAEAVEFCIGENCRCIETAFKDMKLKKHVLVAVIIRNSKVIIPGGGDELRVGDHAVIITKPGVIRNPDDILEVNK